MHNNVCLFLPNLCIGGAERSAANIANGLDDQGYNVSIILIQEKGEYISKLNKGIKIINLNVNKISQSIIPLYKYIKKYNPKCIISFMDHCNVAAIISNKISKNKTKIIPTIHSTISQRKKSFKLKIINNIQIYLYKYIEKIIVVSKEAGEDAKSVLRLSDNKIEVIYNPIITEDMLNNSKMNINHKWIGNEKYVNIIGVGRLTDEKGFEDLIKAFKIVRGKIDNSKLIILGEGSYRKNLTNIVMKLGLNDHIDMPGFVNPYPYMRIADLFVLSSKREGLPSALIESMALGTKVVSTNCKSGPKEILKEGKLGRIVNVGDIDELAAAIIETLENDKIIDYNNSLDDFKTKTVIEKYKNMIEEICKNDSE